MGQWRGGGDAIVSAEDPARPLEVVDTRVVAQHRAAALPGLCGPVHTPSYVHHVPGRIRMEFRQLRNESMAVSTVCTRARAISGVLAVKSNTVIGSITIEYDRQMNFEPLRQELLASGMDLRKRQRTEGSATEWARGGRGLNSSMWKDVAFVGMAAHLILDLILWGTAAGALVLR